MSLDGKLLRRAKERLERARRENEAEYARRQEEVYAKNPEVLRIDKELRGNVMDVIGFALAHGGDPVDAVSEIGSDNLWLQSERIEELISAGFPPDYLDMKITCPLCNDTGYDGIRPCKCLMKLYREEQQNELSALLKLGEETFDVFDLDYYDSTPDPATGVSQRGTMDMVYETCINYAERFGEKSNNLFLYGDTGLGKTFLSTCIAKVVSERGYSVVYDTAISIFSKFEEEKFSRSDDLEGIKSETRRYLSCDLLIMDDLGTEMSTAFTVSALYMLVNTRLQKGKKTIISSNLSPGELQARYSKQTTSRLLGEYQVLRFCGSDIRQLKKKR